MINNIDALLYFLIRFLKQTRHTRINNSRSSLCVIVTRNKHYYCNLE